MSDKKTVRASVAMLKVLEAWGVKQVYGYPGGSFNSTMSALEDEKDNIKYIQIRHEQVGALAAAAEAKLTGKVAVTFGSAGPGAVNLLNGLYDAREDHAPVLALVGQVPHYNMNYNFFQEFDENPIFQDVACYARTVMTAESLPYVVDKAIREAYKHSGVAVVIIPNDFGMVEIPEEPYSSVSPSDNKVAPEPEATDEEVDQVLDLIKNAKRPVFHVGKGIKDHGDQLIELSKKLKIPVIMTGLAKGLIDEEYEGHIGVVNRAGSKSANEMIDISDLIIAIGADFPFANNVYPRHKNYKFVQVDHDEAEFGRHHYLDLGIWSDASQFVDKMLDRSTEVSDRPYYNAAVADNNNWKEYINKTYDRESDPLEAPQLYRTLNQVATPDTIVSLDVGDNTINTLRYLKVGPKNKWTVSALFATMGSGIPGAIAAKLNYPDRQVVSIQGDGAFSMVMQDLITEKKYKLPILNIVTSNCVLGFIKGEQDDVDMKDYSGIDLEDADWAKASEGLGVEATTVTKSSELPGAVEKAVAALSAGKPFLINAKITNKRAFPVEALKVEVEDGKIKESVSPVYNVNHSRPDIKTLPELFAHYDAQELKPLQYFIDKYNVDLN